MARELRKKSFNENFKDAVIAGAAISTVRHIPMALAEFASGMDPSAIALSRFVAAATNIFPSGLAYKEGRDSLYRDSLRAWALGHLPESISSNGNFNRVLDNCFGLPAAIVEGVVSYNLVYPLIGASPDNFTSLPCITGSLLTLLGGGAMGLAIDTFRDGYGLPYHQDRSLFANRKIFKEAPTPEKKYKLVRNTAYGVYGATLGFFLSAHGQEIYNTAKTLVGYLSN